MIFLGFLVMLLVTLSALIGCGVANIFVDRKSARIAGFAFSIGSLSGLTQFNDGAASQLSAAVGAIGGLLLVWYLFFKANGLGAGNNTNRESDA